MSNATGAAMGTTDRCFPPSSPFSRIQKVALPPYLGCPTSISSAGMLPALPPTAIDSRPRHLADSFHHRHRSATFSENDRTFPFDTSNEFRASDSARPRLPIVSVPEGKGNLPATLHPYITLPSPQPLLYSAPKPLYSLPLPHSHSADDLHHTSPSSSGPQIPSGQPPIGGRSLPSPGRRDSSQGTPSRSSSQASAQLAANADDNRASSYMNISSVKVETALSPTAMTRETNTAAPSTPEVQAPVKAKRVRTGCLTCRERHLKCDEGVPDCLNCRKGSRECKRGIRLNFIDIQMKPIPRVAPISDWNVVFVDESRMIASDYVGGAARYPRPEKQSLGETKRRRVPEGIETTRTQAKGFGSRMDFDDMAPSNLERGHDALTRERVQAVPVAGIFGLLSLKDDSGMCSCGFQHNEASSIASPTMPQGHRHSSIASCRADMGEDDGAGSRNREHSYGALPKALPTPPSERDAFRSGAELYLSSFADDMLAGNEEKDYLNSPDETIYMQVFIEDVAPWMDCLNKDRYFSRTVPLLALKSPMLLNALLACGVKRAVQSKRALHADKDLIYYNTATTQLLRHLENPDRNMYECATTAIVLNVYETISEKPSSRMNHIAGARALIRECGWNAHSKGLGTACFWVNMGMEVLSCLSSNWQTSWNPDEWGLDLRFLDDLVDRRSRANAADKHNPWQQVQTEDCDAEVWGHRMIYIMAKIANFRASAPRFQEPSSHTEQVHMQNRFAEWQHLKSLCDGWNRQCPRSMRPFSYSYASHTSPAASIFPDIWMLGRAAAVGRVFYHTAMIVLCQSSPIQASMSEENQAVQLHHARQVCGIVSHSREVGIHSVTMRSLVIAAQVLQDGREQEEVLSTFHRIFMESGWRRTNHIFQELAYAWGQSGEGGHFGSSSAHSSPAMPAPTPQRLAQTGNPLLQADFRLPDHPYKAFYRPPSEARICGMAI